MLKEENFSRRFQILNQLTAGPVYNVYRGKDIKAMPSSQSNTNFVVVKVMKPTRSMLLEHHADYLLRNFNDQVRMIERIEAVRRTNP